MKSNTRGTFPLVFLLAAFAVGLAGLGEITLALAQDPPRTADDDHARRLYEQYKASQERERALEAARRGKMQDATGQAYGTFGGLGVDQEALRDSRKAAQEAERERERQQKLLNAWNKKFSGRFGDLKETSSQAPLPPQSGDKPYRDKMDMRLNWFRYNPNVPKKPPTPGYTPSTVKAPPYPPGSTRRTPAVSTADKPRNLGAGIRPPDDYRDTGGRGGSSGGSSGGGGGGY